MAEASVPSLDWLRKRLQETDPDLLRAMVETVVATLMGAEADALCGAGYGQRHPERSNRRNGYRERGWDTRLGTIPLQIPKLRQGSYFPDWLLEPRRRAERAVVQVVAEAYLLGVSVRRIESLVQTLGIDRLSKSRVAEMAKELDELVGAFRTRPLDTGPYAYLWIDAQTQKCRDGGRVVNVATVTAIGVNAANGMTIHCASGAKPASSTGTTGISSERYFQARFPAAIKIRDRHRVRSRGGRYSWRPGSPAPPARASARRCGPG